MLWRMPSLPCRKSALQNPMSHNRTFLIAMSVFASYVLAFELLSFTLPLLALDISGTGTGLALIKGAGFIPNIIFAIFIGVINDRLRKSFGFRLYTGLLAFCTALLWLGLMRDLVSIPALAVLMIVFNATGYALGNMQLTLIKLTVPQSQLGSATALSAGINSTINTIAPAIGGLALLWFGHTSLTGGITALLCLATLMSFAVRPTETLPAPTPFWPALTEGWQAFRQNRELATIAIAVVATNAATGTAEVGLLLKLKTDLNLDTFTIGLVLASAGIGAVIAATFASQLRNRIGSRAAFLWPIAILAAIYLGMMATNALPLLILLSFLEGATSTISIIAVWSTRQETVAAKHMGRVAGLTTAIFQLGMPPMILLSGILADTGHLWATFGAAAAINILAALYLIYIAKWGWGRPRDLPS